MKMICNTCGATSDEVAIMVPEPGMMTICPRCMEPSTIQSINPTVLVKFEHKFGVLLKELIGRPSIVDKYVLENNYTLTVDDIVNIICNTIMQMTLEESESSGMAIAATIIRVASDYGRKVAELADATDEWELMMGFINEV